MQTGHNENVSKVYVFVDNLLKEARKLRGALKETTEELAQYSLQNPDDVPQLHKTWAVLRMLESLAEMLPKERKGVGEILARLNAWAMDKGGAEDV